MGFWECTRCGEIHHRNVRRCRSCDHNVMRPASPDRVSELSKGVETPESSTPETVGTAPEPDYESSPGVALDGSIESKENDERSFTQKLRSILPFL